MGKDSSSFIFIFIFIFLSKKWPQKNLIDKKKKKTDLIKVDIDKNQMFSFDLR